MGAFDDQLRLRIQSVRAGVLLSYAVCVALVGYSAATWSVPNRPLLVILAAGAAGATVVVNFVPVNAIVASRYCDAFFLTWSFIDLVFITALCASDGGALTPLTALYFLPLAFAALFYPLRIAGATVALTILMYIGVAFGFGSAEPINIGFFTSVLAMIGVLCAWAAREQERRRGEQALLSRTDYLTGCLNRRGLDERFEAELATARRERLSLALVVLDLDGFKIVNDTLGHAAGDELLCWVVETLADVLRPADSIGRLGGDEFAVVLPRTELYEAGQIATRMRGVLARRVSATVGIACSPGDGNDRETLHRAADQQLYGAKAERVA
jgi:diguanylate cyclase (GGDEF)-like protein